MRVDAACCQHKLDWMAVAGSEEMGSTGQADCRQKRSEKPGLRMPLEIAVCLRIGAGMCLVEDIVWYDRVQLAIVEEDNRAVAGRDRLAMSVPHSQSASLLTKRVKLQRWAVVVIAFRVAKVVVGPKFVEGTVTSGSALQLVKLVEDALIHICFVSW